MALCKSEPARAVIGSTDAGRGAIDILTSPIAHSSEFGQEAFLWAALFLSRACINPAVAGSAARSSGLPLLVDLLSDAYPLGTRIAASSAIASLSSHGHARGVLVRAGAVQALVSVVASALPDFPSHPSVDRVGAVFALRGTEVLVSASDLHSHSGRALAALILDHSGRSAAQNAGAASIMAAYIRAFGCTPMPADVAAMDDEDMSSGWEDDVVQIAALRLECQYKVPDADDLRSWG